MPLPERIGPYLVERELGRGGGGIVYLARDVDLDRPVAIKTLPPEMARDPSRLEQLEREAKVLATLSHANVAAIHGLLKAGDERFLVLEYVPGHSLDELLARAPLPIDEAIECARQVADGLEAAHDKGIVHRDLKPANVRRTGDGIAKVLDFGLAKDLSHDLASSGSIGHTSAIVGTPAYLSPEQIRGRPADRGADVWSFGCLLYELLTGRPAFRGASIGDLLQAVLERTPDFDALPPRTPPRVRELIRRCLHRDRRQRLRDIGDARLELEQAQAERTSSRSLVGVPLSPDRRRRALLVTVCALALAFGWLLGRWSGPVASAQPGVRLSFGLADLGAAAPVQDVYGEKRIALSPDGRIVGVLDPGGDTARVFLRGLDRFEASPVAGSAGARWFCFSPDSRYLAMTVPVSRESTELQLVKVPVDGSSPPVPLGPWIDREMLWLENGEIVCGGGPPSCLHVMPPEGGKHETRVLHVPPDVDYGPDALRPLPGSRLLCEVESYEANGFVTSVAVLDLATLELRTVLRDAGCGTWSPTGHLLFTRHDQLLAVPFDPGSGTTGGDPVLVASDLRTRDSWSHAPFHLGADGTLVHLAGGVQGAQRRLCLVARDGAAHPWSSDRMALEERLHVARNGARFCVTRSSSSGLYQVWGSELAPPRLRLLAAEPDADCHNACLSPDGELVYWVREGRAGHNGIVRSRFDGQGAPEPILAKAAETNDLLPIETSPDGRTLVVREFVRSRYSLLLLDLEHEDRRRLLVADRDANPSYAGLDPTGQWIGYVSNARGMTAPYVRRFDREEFTLGPEIRVPLPTGEPPHSASWFLAAEGGAHDLMIWFQASRRLCAVSMRGGAGLPGFDAVQQRFDLRLVPSIDWCPLPDGRLLCLAPGPEELMPGEVRVVTRFVDRLR